MKAIDTGMVNESSKLSHMTRSKRKTRQEMKKHPNSKANSVTPSSSHTNTPMPSPTPSDEVPMISTITENAQTTESRDNCEYYPHKKKRPSPKKKTLLKYRYNLKKIEGLNKRKSCIPQKGQKIEHQDPQRVEYSELTMFEIIRCIEETGMLDDESFMEIVDCPSPVWWEDPPDDEYCEDPIDRELVREALEGTCESPPPIEEDVQIRVQLLNKELKNNDKIIKKKSKLENILGNLKSKITTIYKDDTNREKIGTTEKERDKIIHDDNEKDINRETVNQSRLSESSDGDILSDISINEEELLKNLQTMAIPVQLSNPDTATVTNDIIKLEPIKALETMPTLYKIPESGLISCTTMFSSEFSNIASNSIEAQPLNNVTKPNFIEIQQSESSDRLNDDSNSGDFDSISDTNIRFLDDDDVEMLTSLDEVGNNQDKNESEFIKDITTITKEADDFNMPKITNIRSLKPEAHSDSELVVVYSIVSDPAKKKAKTRPRVKKRKLKTSLERYRDAKMITSLRHNFKTPLNRTEAIVDKRRGMSTDFMSMPRSIANQRRLLCNCSEIICNCHNSNKVINKSNN